MKILIIAEHNHDSLQNSTKNCVTAAQKIGNNIDIFIAGFNCNKVINDASKLAGINNVFFIDNEIFSHITAENMANAIAAIAKNYTHLLAPATTYGKNILPRVAALLDVAMISDVINIENENTFIRPIYAGNALMKIKSSDAIKLITIRPIAFEACAISTKNAPTIKLEIDFSPFTSTRFVKYAETISKRPELTNAKIVVSGGRALQSKENFALIEQLADCLHAAVGATRAAVDAGFAPNDLQVGQTGKVVAPTLYFAIGISGAIQHIAGMKDSACIVAINKDADAPIFQIADYGLVGDLFQIIPELIEKLR